MTWNQGNETADNQHFSLTTDIKVYFCDPQSSWQHGSNEQINELPQQYFLKAMDFSEVHQNPLNALARRLNDRPRKALGYYSPAEKLAKFVASNS